MEQEFSPRRCKDTRKPPADQCPEVAFYRCPACKALYPVTGGERSGKQADTVLRPYGRAPDSNACRQCSGYYGSVL